MYTWITRLRLQAPQWLAKESASTWIMVGTLTGAGLAAPALAGARVPLPSRAAVHAAVPLAPQTQASPAFSWPCRPATVSIGQTGCAGHFRYGRGHGHWRHHAYGATDWAQGRDQATFQAIPRAMATGAAADTAAQ
jgi:hypothetical protein